MTVSLITPTCDRPLAFAWCEAFKRRQTRQPDEWIVADGGKRHAVTAASAQKYGHYPNSPGVLNFINNLRLALRWAEGDIIVFMEDDDYYSPLHVEQLVGFLEASPWALAAGDDRQRYYNVATRQYRTFDNIGASLCQTALRREVVPILLEQMDLCLQRKSYGVDTNFWRALPTERWALKRIDTVVGIKGLPGQPGLGIGHRPKGPDWRDDLDGAVLSSWVGQDASMYFGFHR